jgi:CheY-like chemotaxis protein
MKDNGIRMSKTARILVVDDDELIALTLTAILQEQGYEVAAAFNGKQAIALAAEFFPDLLLSDVHIGAMNGVQAAIRITAKLPHCRVLFLSGHASTGDLLKDVPKRMECSFISKPPNLLDLLNAIAYMLPVEAEASLEIDHAPSQSTGRRAKIRIGDVGVDRTGVDVQNVKGVEHDWP